MKRYLLQLGQENRSYCKNRSRAYERKDFMGATKA